MKRLLFLLLFPTFILSQYTSVPDKVFEETLINLGYDTVFDGKVLTANIIGINNLEFNGLQQWPPVTDFTGIQDFEALTHLSVRFINLKNIEFLNSNSSLTYLNCEGNQLTSLELSNNPELTYLNCEGNQLTSLNLSNNPSLIFLNCRRNQITNLDLRNNTVLTELYCERDQIRNLDLGNNNSVKINKLNETEKKEKNKGKIKFMDYLIIGLGIIFLSFFIITIFNAFTYVLFKVVLIGFPIYKKKCPHCNSDDINFLDKHVHTRPIHTTKKGLADKRYKNNSITTVKYYFECVKCKKSDFFSQSKSKKYGYLAKVLGDDMRLF
jgi:Leucine-rich repeat (LRR) protein